MPRFGNQIDTQGIPVKSLVPETGTAFPGTPINYQIFTRTDLNQTFQYLNAAWVQLDNSGSAAVPSSRQVIAGTGLTGGGDLSVDRTFNVDETVIAKVASPTLTGTPAAPTATAGTNTTQIATTAFVATAVANLVASAPGTLDTLNELATALGDDPNFATTMTNDLAAKAGKFKSTAQSLVAGTPVTITHNLNNSNPVVSFYDATGPLVLDYTVSSANAISVTSAIAVTSMVCVVEG